MLVHKHFYGTDKGVQVYRIVQKAGQYIIVRPGVLHWRFNSGPNVAEAVNFALSNHKQELESIVKNGVTRYQFFTCRSDLEPEVTIDDRCLGDYDARVVMFTPEHLEAISNYYERTRGRHKCNTSHKRHRRCARPYINSERISIEWFSMRYLTFR